jgi:hypothetical protein
MVVVGCINGGNMGDPKKEEDWAQRLEWENEDEINWDEIDVDTFDEIPEV